jgi:hypothetical protein
MLNSTRAEPDSEAANLRGECNRDKEVNLILGGGPSGEGRRHERVIGRFRERLEGVTFLLP